MRNFFPNIETAVIAIFILCVALWGASRCKKKKEEASLRNATENTVSLIDTVSSPAATRTVVPPLPPRTVATAPVVDPSNPPPSTINNPNGIPQSYSTTPTPLPSSPTTVRQTPVPMPSTTQTTPQMGRQTATTTTTPKAAPVEQGGASLYVLSNQVFHAHLNH